MSSISESGDMLGLQGVDPQTHGRIRTARVLAAALTSPECRLEIKALADHTGMTTREVTEILTSPDWQEAVRCQLLSLAGAGLIGLVDQVRKIVENNKEKTADRLSAFRALCSLWKDSASISAATESVEAEETAKAFLKSVKPMKMRIVAEENNEST